jgi:hypothetical protein
MKALSVLKPISSNNLLLPPLVYSLLLFDGCNGISQKRRMVISDEHVAAA